MTSDLYPSFELRAELDLNKELFRLQIKRASYLWEYSISPSLLYNFTNVKV